MTPLEQAAQKMREMERTEGGYLRTAQEVVRVYLSATVEGMSPRRWDAIGTLFDDYDAHEGRQHLLAALLPREASL